MDQLRMSRAASSALRACLTVLLALALVPLRTAYADAPVPVVDQFLTAPSDAQAALNRSARYTAQTFTAGLTGALTAVSLDVASTSPYFLKVAIHGVTAGLPNGTVLSDVYVWGTGGVPQSAAPLTLMIDVGTVYVQAGHQYAIVVQYDGSGAPGEQQGSWAGASGDAYPGGRAFETNDATFTDWTALEPAPLDLHFKTYVVPNVPVHDLSVRFDGGAKHAKACELFEENVTVTNNGPDTASNVVLQVGVTDQFDVMSIQGVDGRFSDPLQLAAGESVSMQVIIKTTAFVPGESRDGRFWAHAASEVWPQIELDPNEANDYYFGSVRLIAKGAERCP